MYFEKTKGDAENRRLRGKRKEENGKKERKDRGRDIPLVIRPPRIVSLSFEQQQAPNIAHLSLQPCAASVGPPCPSCLCGLGVVREGGGGRREAGGRRRREKVWGKD